MLIVFYIVKHYVPINEVQSSEFRGRLEHCQQDLDVFLKM